MKFGFGIWRFGLNVLPVNRVVFLALLLLFSASALRAQADREYIIVSGGPSLMEWEKFKAEPHDRWWGNFIRSARLRIQEIRKELGPGKRITWLVHRPSYARRAARMRGQDNTDVIANILSVRDKFDVNLVWFDDGGDVINYLNAGMPRNQVKVSGFEFFGHSNSRCFMFDYSNEIDSGSKAWLHQNDFRRLHRGIFAKDAFIKSWGCHTGESMSKAFRRATGKRMIGAIGKTDYSHISTQGQVLVNGRWGG